MFLYIVISPAPEDLDWSTTFVDEVFTGANLIIKEFGKWGDHPHFNIISEVPITQKSCKSWREKVLRKARKQHTGLSGKWISVQEIYDLSKLLGGYLQKESQFEVIKTDGKYDLEKYKMKSRKFSTKHKWKYIPSFLEFPLFYLEYVEDVYYPHQVALGNGKHNLKEHLAPFQRVLNHMLINGIAVHHLYRRREELEEVIDTISGSLIFENI